jgi:hypothetical protein
VGKKRREEGRGRKKRKEGRLMRDDKKKGSMLSFSSDFK